LLSHHTDLFRFLFVWAARLPSCFLFFRFLLLKTIFWNTPKTAAHEKGHSIQTQDNWQILPSLVRFALHFLTLNSKAMNIIGRTTKNAVVNTVSDGRKVVNFSIAVNDYYRPKTGDPVQLTTYYDCAYWLSERLAEHLKQGTLVEVSGRVHVSAYLGADGNPRASLKCHVSSVKIHAWPKEQATQATPAGTVATPEADDDLPF
jgi:single-strand DNA-binding protein